MHAKPKLLNHPVATGALFLAGYVGLDWVSFIHAWAPIGITPWNPPPGLSLALLLIKDLRWAPLLAVAALLADVLVRGLPAPWPPTLLSAAVIASGYTAAAALLRRLLHTPPFGRVNDVLLLLGVGAGAALLVGLGYVGVFTMAGHLPVQDFAAAVARFWIGDMIGIAVATPLAVIIAQDARPRLNGETMAQLLALGLALWVIFGIKATNEFQFFYLLFLPTAWIAVRHGLAGAAAAAALTQAGLVLAFHLSGQPAATVTSLQFLMLALAATTLVLGAAVGERERAQAALASSRRRLAAVLDTAGDGILTITPEGRVDSANPAARTAFGGDPTGAGIDRLLPGLDLGGAGGDVPGVRSDGTTFPAEVAVARGDVGGENVHVVVVRDVSARRDAEARLREHQARLAHFGRISTAGEMASALAHELNQPLTAAMNYIRGCRRLLAAEPLDRERLRHAIDKATEQAERAGEIIRRLREFIRKGNVQPAPTAVGPILADVAGLLAADAHQRGIVITIDSVESLPEVVADRIQIEQVLMNLVRNAIDALDDVVAPRIRIVAEAREGVVEFAVSDNGCGVPAEVAERLFTAFATTKTTGMGLGLAISRGIVEAYGGRLWLTRGDGAGTTFRFTIPTVMERRQ